MFIAQKKYRHAITMQKSLKNENDINVLKKIEKSDHKMFWKSIKRIINNINFNENETISDQEWVDYFHSLYNKQNKHNLMNIFLKILNFLKSSSHLLIKIRCY